MRSLDRDLLGHLSDQILELSQEMMRLEASLLKQPLELHEEHRQSARNLAHYLALRRHDIRKLQSQLAALGLSSLGRTEGHVLSAVQAVQRVLHVLLGDKDDLPATKQAIEIDEGDQILETNTEVLLGPAPPERKVRIMVTMPSEAATDYALVRDLLRNGMDCMRINCAHDNAGAWSGMVANLERARAETGRACRILMDVAGPKLRTGSIETGAAVIKCRPKRNEFGRVVAPARVWLTPEEASQPAPASAAATLELPGEFLATLRVGDRIALRDARKAARSLRVSYSNGRSRWAETRQTIYFVPNLTLRKITQTKKGERVVQEEIRLCRVPAMAQMILLKRGDTLLMTRSEEMGRPAVYDKMGQLVAPAQISVSIPEVLEHAKAGEQIWFDDGKIGGVIRSVGPEAVTVEITQARPSGEKLAAEKGINLPETRIDIPALTAEDLENLKFIVQHADLVGYSFVRTESDVKELLDRLAELNGSNLGIVLKIETRKGFENLPRLILSAMRIRSFGVMIARGDLAVECGFQRLAEVQEEILWICEAGHVPVIWATQVLETLAKKGLPSRSEITDAAMGERAECVMLNKGPYVVSCVSVLADILTRMQSHQEKKRSMLRRLRLATAVANAD